MVLKILRFLDDTNVEEVKNIIKKEMINGNEFEPIEKIVNIGNEQYNVSFYAYTKESNEEIAWLANIEQIMNKSYENINRPYISAYGIMLIYNKKIKYAIAFGREIIKIYGYIDWDFGLDMASKILDGNSLRKQSMKYASTIKSRASVSFFDANFNPKAGEAIVRLEGKITEKKGHKYVNDLGNLIKNNVIFCGGVNVDYKIEEKKLEDIVHIVNDMEEIRKKYTDNKLKIPRIKYLSNIKDREKIEILNEKLSKYFYDNDLKKDNVTEEIKVDIKNYLSSFIIKQGRKKTESKEILDIDDIKDFMKKNNIKDITKLKLIENGFESSILNYIDTRIEIGNDLFTLEGQNWARLNKDFIRNIDEDIKYLYDTGNLNVSTDYDFNFNEEKNKEYRKNHKNQYNEKIMYGEYEYNIRIANQKGYILYDRKNSNGIEVCDLYDKETKSLIHVKRGYVSDFKYCIEQSRDGLMELMEANDENLPTIKEIEYIVLIFLTNNKGLLEDNNLINLKSPMFKIKLVEWVQFVMDQKKKAKIIVAKNE